MQKKTSNAVNNCADSMLNKITQCIKEELKTTPRVCGAVVSSIGENGKVNVYFPPDKDKIFTNISNQTPFELKEGDSVELLLKDGSYSNCWVVAKHATTFVPSCLFDTNEFQAYIKQIVKETLKEVLTSEQLNELAILSKK